MEFSVGGGVTEEGKRSTQGHNSEKENANSREKKYVGNKK